MRNEPKESELSRRKFLKGAATVAAVASSGVISACESGKKPRNEAKLATGTPDFGSIKTLAVWLALTARPKFDDFDPSTYTDAQLANKVASDMGIADAGVIGEMTNIITSVRTTNHLAYLTIQKDLRDLSNVLYPPNQCPKNYATLLSMAQGTCQ
jgi:hypothetical protein